MIRSGEAPAVGWSRSMLYSGFITLPRSIVRRRTGFAARISRTLFGLKMIRIDLENFVETGRLGPFTTKSTRQEIADVLGPPEPESYPGIVTYGHLAFDLCGGSACQIQIGFPHPSHMRPADPNWKNWTPPTCFEEWPDKRFKWTLGRLIPGLNIQNAISFFKHLEEAEMIHACNGLRILCNQDSRVELSFQNDENNHQTTLSSIVAHPK